MPSRTKSGATRSSTRGASRPPAGAAPGCGAAGAAARGKPGAPGGRRHVASAIDASLRAAAAGGPKWATRAATMPSADAPQAASTSAKPAARAASAVVGPDARPRGAAPARARRPASRSATKASTAEVAAKVTTSAAATRAELGLGRGGAARCGRRRPGPPSIPFGRARGDGVRGQVGAREQHARAAGDRSVGERLDQPARAVLGRDQVRLDAGQAQRVGGGRARRRHQRPAQRPAVAQLGHEAVDGVGRGEDHPVVAPDRGRLGPQRGTAVGRRRPASQRQLDHAPPRLRARRRARRRARPERVTTTVRPARGRAGARVAARHGPSAATGPMTITAGGPSRPRPSRRGGAHARAGPASCPAGPPPPACPAPVRPRTSASAMAAAWSCP